MTETGMTKYMEKWHLSVGVHVHQSVCLCNPMWTINPLDSSVHGFSARLLCLLLIRQIHHWAYCELYLKLTKLIWSNFKHLAIFVAHVGSITGHVRLKKNKKFVQLFTKMCQHTYHRCFIKVLGGSSRLRNMWQCLLKYTLNTEKKKKTFNSKD